MDIYFLVTSGLTVLPVFLAAGLITAWVCWCAVEIKSTALGLMLAVLPIFIICWIALYITFSQVAP